MSRLRSYAPLKRQSDKVKKGAPDFTAVYAEVDARSEGRCEWQGPHDEALRGRLGGGSFEIRAPLWSKDVVNQCTRRATDHHHTLKPRRSHHNAASIIALCRGHHDRCEWPYSRGRGVVTPLGNGRFRCEIRFAASKFEARGQGA